MRVALVDDLPLDREQIARVLSDYENEKHVAFNISPFDSGEAFLSAYKPLKYDLVFLDIYMCGMSGLETAAKIREHDDHTKIVFLTTSKDCQAQAIHFHVYDYVNKEDQAKQIPKIMDRILHKPATPPEPVLLIYCDRKSVKILPKNIISVVSDGNHLLIDTTDGVTYTPRMTFASVKDTLETDSRFLEILRGILVNMNYIEDLSDNTCFLNDGRQYPISLRKSRQIIRTWHDFLYEQVRGEGRN